MRTVMSALLVAAVWAAPLPARAWVFDEDGRAAPENLQVWRSLNELAVELNQALPALGKSCLRLRSFSASMRGALLLLEELALYAREFETTLEEMQALPHWLRQGEGLALSDAQLRQILQHLCEEALAQGQLPEPVCEAFAAVIALEKDPEPALETVLELLSCCSDTGCTPEQARDVWFALRKRLDREQTLQALTSLALLAADGPSSFPEVWQMYQQLSHLGMSEALEGVEAVLLAADELELPVASMLRDYRSLAELEDQASGQALHLLFLELRRRHPAEKAWATYFELFRQLRPRLDSAWDAFDLIEVLAEETDAPISDLGAALLPILEHAQDQSDLPGLVASFVQLAGQHGHELADLGALYAGLREDGVGSAQAGGVLGLLASLGAARQIPLRSLRATFAQLLAAEDGLQRDAQAAAALSFVAGFEPKSGRGLEACVGIWLRMRAAEDATDDAIGNLELILHAASEGGELDSLVAEFLQRLEQHGGVGGTALARRDFREEHLDH